MATTVDKVIAALATARLNPANIICATDQGYRGRSETSDSRLYQSMTYIDDLDGQDSEEQGDFLPSWYGYIPAFCIFSMLMYEQGN